MGSVKSKVNSLRGGTLPLSADNRTVTEVFEGTDETPVIAVVDSETNLKRYDNDPLEDRFIIPNTRVPGQVYIMIPNNKGSYMPAKAYSTPLTTLLESSPKDDWYIQQIISAIKDLTKETLDFKTKTGNLNKLFRIPGLNVQLLAGNEKTNDVTAATQLKFTFTMPDGSAGVTLLNSINFDNDDVILGVIKNIVHDANSDETPITTSVDITKLGDSESEQEYRKNISKYLNVNLAGGHPYTINDWFTWTPTSVENNAVANEVVKPAPAQRGKGGARKSGAQVTLKGKDYTIENGKVTSNDGTPVGQEEGKEVLKADKKNNNLTVNSAITIELGTDTTPKSQEDNAEFAVAAHAVGEETKVSAETKASNAKKVADIAAVLGSTNTTSTTDTDTSTPNKGRSLKALRKAAAKKGALASITPKENKDNGKKLLVSDTNDKEGTKEIAEKDIAVIKKMFPGLTDVNAVVLHKGLIKTVDEKGNPIDAYGQFKDGVLYISDRSPKGTAYHEAFHYITDVLLTSEEKEDMFRAARDEFGNLSEMELEEKTAEEFRDYMNGFNGITGPIVKIYRKLKNIVKSLMDKQNDLDSLFYSIYNGRYSNRSGNNVQEDTFKNDLLKYKSEKLSYDNLDAETKELLSMRKVSKEDYEALDIEGKENILKCML